MDIYKAIKLLNEQIHKIEALKKPPAFNPEYKIWKNTTIKVLQDAFNREYVEMFDDAGPAPRLRMNSSSYYRMYLERLEEQKQLLEGFIKEHERLTHIGERIISEKIVFGNHKLHPEIESVSLSLFNNSHYAQAVGESLKRVINEVKNIMQQKGLGIYDGGDSLMNHAFGCERQTPAIKFNNLQNIEERDEQKGIMFLFKGIVGVRNRKAHENVILNSHERAIEYFCLSSLLMRLLDLSKSFDT